ncbi:hypothetical protein [Jiulongibacter sp. NS-SX5]|uniref:hypothetical protein n=1 Tax=Jiulongibacter sp. NS-SX5 TaxID=3463854 RepID=UPI004059BFCF
MFKHTDGAVRRPVVPELVGALGVPGCSKSYYKDYYQGRTVKEKRISKYGGLLPIAPAGDSVNRRLQTGTPSAVRTVVGEVYWQSLGCQPPTRLGLVFYPLN